jgi:hypothetical protein
MNEQTESLVPSDPSAPDEQDPLSGAASGWEAPKFPNLAPDRIYEFVIKSVTKEKVKEHPEREQLKFTLATNKDYTDTDGKPLRAGFKGFTYTGITPIAETDDKRGRTLKQIGAELAQIIRCCKGPQAESYTPRDLINNPDMVVGDVVYMRVGLSKATAEYPNPTNTLKWVEQA